MLSLKCKNSHAKIICKPLMKKLLLFTLGVSATLIFARSSVTGAQGTEPDSGAVVCAPAVYLELPGDCLPLGPSAYLTEMAGLGMTFPPRPFPALKPDPALTQLPYRYFHLEEDLVPILSGPAGGETGQAFPP